MQKECLFCQNIFEAKRSDAKYCSSSCKQEAYLARKNLNKINSTDQTSERTLRRNNVRNVNPSITLSRSEFQRILNTSSSKAPLDQLLNEKDFGRQVLSENAELRIELKYLNKELDSMLRRLETIEAENKDLTAKIESQDESALDKVFNNLLSSDQLAPIIGSIISKNSKSGIIGATPPLDVALKSNQVPIPKSGDLAHLDAEYPITEEEKLENEYLAKLEEVYPEIPPHIILGKLVELIKGNKVLADSIIKD